MSKQSSTFNRELTRPVRPARPSQLLARGTIKLQCSYGGVCTMLAKLQHSRQVSTAVSLEGYGSYTVKEIWLRHGSRLARLAPHHERSLYMHKSNPSKKSKHREGINEQT
jgi:hypothetical protein